MPFSHFRPAILACALAGFAAPAHAQDDLSVDDLVNLLERQTNLFEEAQSSGTGATRGLKLVTVEDVADTAESVSVRTETSDTADAGTDTSTGTVTPVAADPNKPLVIGQLDPELQINLHIKFGFDSAALSADEKPKLDKMCQALKQSSVKQVSILGHTDSSGSEDYNLRLSELRAEEVARHLVDECGIDRARLRTKGLGESLPYNSNDTRADENRRVEFQALS